MAAACAWPYDPAKHQQVSRIALSNLNDVLDPGYLRTKLSNLVRGDLDWIVMKALEKDRTRWYETADGFAEAIERFLQDEAFEA